MSGLSRRGFLGASVGAAAGAATLGPLGVAPALAALGVDPADGAVVALVRPGSTGQISFLVGEREITAHNPLLVSKILKAAR
jgi:hypothetical protein